MPAAQNVSVDVRDLVLDSVDGPAPLRDLDGVRLLVLIRHRH